MAVTNFSAATFNVGTSEEHYDVLVERKPDSQYTACYLHSVVAHASKAEPSPSVSSSQ